MWWRVNVGLVAKIVAMRPFARLKFYGFTIGTWAIGVLCIVRATRDEMTPEELLLERENNDG